jgi:hypothetical protein
MAPATLSQPRGGRLRGIEAEPFDVLYTRSTQRARRGGPCRALLKTASRHDPEFSPEVEAAWRDSLAVGIDYIRSGH